MIDLMNAVVVMDVVDVVVLDLVEDVDLVEHVDLDVVLIGLPQLDPQSSPN